jgi:ATP-dependent phosphofructokinase / diphosphate-dependent phosphofructokinase
MRIAINTGGGDAPGLNAAIRSATLSALRRGWEVVGIGNGYGSLYTDKPFVPLTAERVRGITMMGGTILGTANRGNPFAMPYKNEKGEWELEDRSDEAVEVFHRYGVEALVAIGGDGSMHIANKLSEKGIKVVGVPKTIDNDIWGCDISLGFDTAVITATDAIDKITTTAASHHRIMVVEVMGRYAGWIALHAGLSASADVILIPEIEFSLESVAKKILYREGRGDTHSVVVAAEGAVEIGGSRFVKGKVPGQSEQLGGVAEYLEKELSERTGKEARSLVLGHLQRGGIPSAHDRLISLRFGAAAIRALADNDFNRMIVMQQNEIKRIPLEEVAGKNKLVPINSDTVLTAREIGICLGDEPNGVL